MQLITVKNRFELQIDTKDQAEDADRKGFRFDGRSLTYFTLSPHIASYYYSLADDNSKQLINQYSAAVNFSKATSCKGLRLPKPSGLSYLEFQEVGIAYALPRQRTLIADEPGLGKTIQAIGVANSNLAINSILIVCPSILKTNWRRELQKWFLRCESIGFATPGQPLPNTKIVITTYESIAPVSDSVIASNKAANEADKLAAKRGKEADRNRKIAVAIRHAALADLREEIENRHWDMLICDEAHNLQNSETLRARGILGIDYGKDKCPAIRADKYLWLTGTPLVNRPENLWTLIRACDPEDLGVSWDYYARRYCSLWKAPWGWDSSGAKNLEELQPRLRGKFMIRRLKQDVLKDLPPKRRQIVAIPAPPELQDLLEKERRVVEPLRLKLENVIQAAEAALESANQEGDWEGFKKKARDLPGSTFGDFTELSKIRHDVAVAKLPHAIEYTRLMVESHGKVVVFAHHKDVHVGLYNAFKGKLGVEAIYGDIDEDARIKAIDNFQENPDCRLIICALTMSVGFTLTAAYYALAVELDWRSVIMDQCIDRLHRIGQMNEVIMQFLVFENSLDAQQVRKLISKQTVIDKAIG